MPAHDLTTPDAIATQYASTQRLATRRGVWGPGPEGVSPIEVLLQAVIEERPGSVVEIGCGTGELARSIVESLPDLHYVATDISAVMVASARALGVEAIIAPADGLPFGDDSIDVAVAAWMLYHVPDLDAALSEVRRVLRPGGVLVAATNGSEHLGQLLRDAGGEPLITQFTSEVAESVLGRHFAAVTRRDIETRASFADHAAAAAYLATFDPGLSRALPAFDGPRAYAGSTAILTAR
jgi:SAM-dependent methyltransferase